MKKRTHILGVPFDVGTMEETVAKVKKMLAEDGQYIICTPNPEIVMEAQKDKELMQILQQADLVVPDGIGIVWASKYSQVRLTERVAGYDMVQRLMEEATKSGDTFYFFGGAPGVAAAAARHMMHKYTELQITGVHNGYFDEKEEKHIVADIKEKSPSILLVGLGAPKQEKWIRKNLHLTGAKIAVGVGGSFDVMAGSVRRAPVLFQKLGLEWFYRLITQPTRWKRMMRLPKFVLAVLKTKGR